MHVHVRDDQDMSGDRPQEGHHAHTHAHAHDQPNGQAEQRFDQGQRHGADVEGDGNGFAESGSSAEEKTAAESQVAPEVTEEK